MLDVPDGSLYYWCYTMGLKHVDLTELAGSVALSGKELREKDIQNYWNGWYRSDTGSKPVFSIGKTAVRQREYWDMRWTDYPIHPYLGMPEFEQRWVPCDDTLRPLIRWSEGCMQKVDAECMRGCSVLGENMLATKMIVIDCDGDHDKEMLDLDAIRYLSRFIPQTHSLAKPKTVSEYGPLPFGAEDIAYQPASFHLTFAVDRVVPTMHFPKAHIDIVGNKRNSLRFWKNKVWNGLEPTPMTDEIWESIKQYIRSKEEYLR